MTTRPDPHGQPGVYPTRWEADVALTDGGTAHIRPVRPSDAGRLEAFHARQSRESIYFRYFSPMPTLSARELERLTKVDYLDHLSLLALLDDEIIGMAGFDRVGSTDEAEVAFITDDRHHGRGLATVLLEWLVVAARELGFRRLTAQVLPNNRSMLAVFHQTGFETTSAFEGGVVDVHLGLEPSAEASDAIEERGRRAEARSVERLVSPTSIAVIGAGRERGGLGHEVFRNLLAHDFNGPVYPVNPLGGPVASVPSYPTVLEIPHEVDLAIVAVPAHEVLGVVDQCGRKRVLGLVVMSAGLHGGGPEGDTAERELVDRARRHGMRLIGPESLGVINTEPEVGLHATIAQIEVIPGRVGFMTQSGTLGIAALEHASRVGLGFSTFVDAGAKADVSGNDLLQFWEEDENTRVVLLYLESFGNPRKFTRLARRLSRRKPIVAVKALESRPPGPARTDDSGEAPATRWPHDATVGAMLGQSGVLRVDTPTELFDVARTLVDQPVPLGRRVAIVSNSRGSSNLALDACYGAGLSPAVLSPDTRARLGTDLSDLVKGSSVANPVDLTFAAGPEAYELAWPVCWPTRASTPSSWCTPRPTSRCSTRWELPSPGRWRPGPGRCPWWLRSWGRPSTRRWVRATCGSRCSSSPAKRPASWVTWPPGPSSWPNPKGWFPTSIRPSSTVPGGCWPPGWTASPGSRWLSAGEGAELLARCGLGVIPFRLVDTADQAVAAADELGHPVVVKATGLPRLGRSEAGGVALDVHGPDEVRSAYERMVEGLGSAMRPAMVQCMAPSGVDVLVAGHQDPTYGSIVSLGLGGSVADANPRRAVRVLPLTDADAHRLVQSSPLVPLLASAAGDVTGHLEALLVRLAWIVEQLPELADVELNPVLAAGDAVSITAARVRIATPAWEPEPEVRRLR